MSILLLPFALCCAPREPFTLTVWAARESARSFTITLTKPFFLLLIAAGLLSFAVVDENCSAGRSGVAVNPRGPAGCARAEADPTKAIRAIRMRLRSRRLPLRGCIVDTLLTKD